MLLDFGWACEWNYMWMDYSNNYMLHLLQLFGNSL